MEMRTYSTTQRVCQSRQRCGTNSSTLCEPHVTVPRRSGKDERLRQTRQDLAKHDYPKDASIRLGTGVPDPVAKEKEHGSRDDTVPGATVQQINDKRGGYGKGEKETCRQPIDGCFRGAEVGSCCGRHGRKREPLSMSAVRFFVMGRKQGVEEKFQRTSQLTTMFNSTSCANPSHRRLYTLKCAWL